MKPLSHKILYTKQDVFAQYNDLLIVSGQRCTCMDVQCICMWFGVSSALAMFLPCVFPSEPLDTLLM